MLRGSPLTAAVVAVVHSDANPQAVLHALQEIRGCETLHVSGRRDDKDPVALTLDIYVQPDPQTQEKPSAMPACARKCTWAALKQLRADLLLAVGGNNTHANGSHCEQCAQFAEFLEHCFERPAVFKRSWNGVMVLSTSRVAYFVNTLLSLARSMNQQEINTTSDSFKSHERVVVLLSAFLVPGAKKTE